MSFSPSLREMSQWHPSVDEAKAPTGSDPRWAAWSRPVLEFLATPQSWRGINKWCRERRFGAVKIRHCVAWLEENGLAHSFGWGDQLVWVSTSYDLGRGLTPTETGEDGDAKLSNGKPMPSTFG
jgi:hypothetical protein